MMEIIGKLAVTGVAPVVGFLVGCFLTIAVGKGDGIGGAINALFAGTACAGIALGACLVGIW